MDKNDISTVLTGLLDAFSTDNRAAYAQVKGHPVLQEAAQAAKDGDAEAFRFVLLRRLDQIVEGLLETEFPGNHRLHFLMQQGQFVEMHFKKIIVTKEGSACSSDKSGWLMDALGEFFLTGREIVITHTEKSFWLPETVFTTHADIVEFFEAVYRLYAGQPDAYLKALQKILAQKPASAGR